MRWVAAWGVGVGLALAGCRSSAPERAEHAAPLATIAAPGADAGGARAQGELALDDDAYAFVTRADYRRAVLERDLVEREAIYAKVRLSRYSRADPRGWDRRELRAWSSLPLTLEDAAQISEAGELPERRFPPSLAASYGDERQPRLPESQEEWISLGERVFFEFPMSVAPSLGRALREGADLRDYGVLVHDDAYVGVRLTEVEGRTRVAATCAICHASLGAEGRPSGVRANRAYDLGKLRLAHAGAREHSLVDQTRGQDLAKLGPGRSDVQRDEQFNPYAFPDFGGIADLPYLHHTANWHNRGIATLAIRIETVFMTRARPPSRPPRVLMWALACYLRALPPPPPVAEPSAASERGRRVFEAEGCDQCHAPPAYTSELRVPVSELGTDPGAGRSTVRGTGYWRVPSLRGVGGNAPYLHHGAFATLEQMFEPGRSEPGHEFGLELDAEQRSALLAFLRTI